MRIGDRVNVIKTVKSKHDDSSGIEMAKMFVIDLTNPGLAWFVGWKNAKQGVVDLPKMMGVAEGLWRRPRLIKTKTVRLARVRFTEFGAEHLAYPEDVDASSGWSFDSEIGQAMLKDQRKNRAKAKSQVCPDCGCFRKRVRTVGTDLGEIVQLERLVCPRCGYRGMIHVVPARTLDVKWEAEAKPITGGFIGE